MTGREVWLPRLSAGIIALAVLEFIVATVSVRLAEPPPEHTDFASYYMAGVFARERRSPYDAGELVERSRRMGLEQSTYPFVYAPPFALAMRPLAAMPFVTARRVWVVLGTVFVLLALVTTAVLVRNESHALGAHDPAFVWVLMAAFVPAALNSAPVHADIRVGSVGALLWTCFVVVAWRMLRGGRPAWLVGLAVAVAVLAKTTPAILLAWMWWRGARRAVAWSVALLAASMIPALLVWGPGIVGTWIRDGIAARLAVPAGWAHNVSLDATLLRIFEPRAVVATAIDVPLAHRALFVALAIACVVVVVRALRQSTGPVHRGLECGLVVLSMLVLAPITWVHTIAAMLFVWPVQMVAIRSLGNSRATRALAVGACASFFLAAAHLPVLWGDRLQFWPWILLTSAHLLGLLGLLGTGVVLCSRTSPAAVGAGAAAARAAAIC